MIKLVEKIVLYLHFNLGYNILKHNNYLIDYLIINGSDYIYNLIVEEYLFQKSINPNYEFGITDRWGDILRILEILYLRIATYFTIIYIMDWYNGYSILYIVSKGSIKNWLN
jgi:hypothetical protein